MTAFISLGIDQSKSDTGLIVMKFDNKKPEVLDARNVRPPPEYSGINAALWIADQVSKTLDEHPGVGDVAMEGYNLNNRFSLSTLVEIGTIIRHRVLLRRGALWIAAPLAVKSFAGGAEAAKAKTKAPIKKALKERWGLSLKNADQRDAAVIALMVGAARGELIITPEQRATVGKMQRVTLAGPLQSTANSPLTQPAKGVASG